MGVILSRFRKKKSTLDVLEGLEKEIKSIEEYGQTTERQHKAVVGRLVLFSVGIYVLTAGLFYFFFFPASLYDQLLYVIPLLLFPLIIVLVKRLVSWWYRRKISRNQDKLCDMKKQKKELLEEVMDKETYKVAHKILEKFAPEQLRKSSASAAASAIVARAGLDPGKFSGQLSLSQRSIVPGSPPGSAGTEVRRRPVGTQVVPTGDRFPLRQMGLSPGSPRLPSPGVVPTGHMMTSESTSVITSVPGAATVATDSIGDIAATVGTATADAAASAAIADDKPNLDSEEEEEEEEENDVDDDKNNDESGKDSSTGAEVADDKGEKNVEEGPRKGGTPPSPTLRLTRPVLPRERSVMDRLVEYLVGDGVNQRYALICRNCSSHNGMALKEEFEYLAFQCCYCFHWNPARKQRLQAPRLEALPSSGNTTTSSSPAESNTEEEDDSSPRSKKTVPREDSKENKSESHERKASTSSSDGIMPANTESAESPSSTEAEFESLVPDTTAAIPSAKEDSANH